MVDTARGDKMNEFMDALNRARDVASEHSADALLVCTSLSIITCLISVLTSAAATIRINRLAACVSEMERSLASLRAEEARRLVLDIKGSTPPRATQDASLVQREGAPRNPEQLHSHGSAQL